MRIPVTAVIPLTLAVAAGTAFAGTVALAPVHDATMVESDEGSLADGQGSHLRAGRTNQSFGSVRRSLLRFDPGGALPAGARVVEATLILHKSSGTTALARLTLHRVTADWGEGPADFDGGQGVAATPGDVTWLHRFHDPADPEGSPAWVEPGGDFVPAPSAEIDVGENGYYSLRDDRMARDVQRWLNAPSTNAGWVLVGDESLSGSVKRFDSRNNDDPAVRPLLLIEFRTLALPR